MSYITDVTCLEDQYFDDLLKKQFYESIDLFGIDLNKIFKSNNSINKNQLDIFNYVLRKIKEEFGISLIESTRIICEDYSTVSELLKLFDQETKYLIKWELAQKYKIKIDEYKDLEKFFIK